MDSNTEEDRRVREDLWKFFIKLDEELRREEQALQLQPCQSIPDPMVRWHAKQEKTFTTKRWPFTCENMLLDWINNGESLQCILPKLESYLSEAKRDEARVADDPARLAEEAKEVARLEKEKRVLEEKIASQVRNESLRDMIILGACDGTAFSGDQQKKFGVNEAGDIQDPSKHEKAIASLQEIRKRITEAKARVLSLDDFIKNRIDPGSVVHLKGFGQGLEDKYEEDILKTISKYQVLVWDGDEYDTTGFTKMVPKFLDANAQGECVAFRLDYEVDDFKESWADVIEQYPSRISIVSIDLKFPSLVDAKRLGVLEEMAKAVELPDWAQEYFLLGRVACQATQSTLVISMGGGGISKSEAEAGIAIGVEWEVIDLRRAPNSGNPVDADGWRDEQGRALMDWVRNESGKVDSSIGIEKIGQRYRLRQAAAETTPWDKVFQRIASRPSVECWSKCINLLSEQEIYGPADLVSITLEEFEEAVLLGSEDDEQKDFLTKVYELLQKEAEATTVPSAEENTEKKKKDAGGRRDGLTGPDGKILDVGSESDFAVIIPEKLVLGNVMVADDLKQLQRLGIKSVVNLIKYDDDEGPSHSDYVTLHHCPIEDKSSTGLDWAEECAKFVQEQLDENARTYVHCSQGISRAPTLVIYYLMTRCNKNLREALDYVRVTRSRACPAFGFIYALAELDVKLNSTCSMSADEYRLACLKTVFPSLPEETIKQALLDAEEIQAKDVATSSRSDVMKAASLGSLAIDLLKERHVDAFVRRRGCSTHHPFD